MTAPRIDHIGIIVGDLDAAAAHGRIVFLPRDPHTGLLFELCQPDAAQLSQGEAP
ncbi:MAG: hypothetical protein KJ011_16975 [Burkholderiaceae bacterium]|nr:hypothetical protein [Burkholderiaceae bacterium]